MRTLEFIKAYWIALTVLTLAVITILSPWPSEALPAAPGGDKAHHVVAYAALMFPPALRKPTGWQLIGFFFIAYSGAIELVQPYFNRYGDFLDMAANSAGVVCGWAVAEIVNYFRLPTSS